MQAELFFSFFSVFKVLLLNISKTYSDSDCWETTECHLSKETNTCISSNWPKNSMQFTLGMPFLGKFNRNRKGLMDYYPRHGLSKNEEGREVTLLNCDFLPGGWVLRVYLCHTWRRLHALPSWRGVDVGDVDSKALKLLVEVNEKISADTVKSQLLTHAPADKKEWVKRSKQINTYYTHTLIYSLFSLFV